MRTPFVAANWKMHKTVHQALVYATELRAQVRDFTDVEIVIAPPFTVLHAIANAFVDTRVGVAGQDLYWETHGAFTGEVSAEMLKEAGADYVIIGHSERRHLFGETDGAVNAKVRAAVGGGLTPIMCVGETLAERESNQTFTVLDQQLAQGLAALSASQAGALVVAYEPVWAIGTGRNATPGQAQEAHAHIRQRLTQDFGDGFGAAHRIIYGGSVQPANARELSMQVDVDGALVGGAGLDAGSLVEIIARSRPATV